MKNQSFTNDAIHCALKFVTIYPGNARHDKAFKTLVDLTLADLNSEKLEEKYKYDADRIAKEMGETNPKDIRDALNKLTREIPSRHITTFNELAAKYHFSAIPKVKVDLPEGKKNEGGRERKNYYYVDYLELQASSKDAEIEKTSNETETDFSSDNKYSESNLESSNTHLNIENNQIEYFLENISLPKVFNWMVNYELSGFRFFLDIAKFILALIIAAFSAVLINFYFTHASSFFDFLKKIEPLIIINFVMLLFVKNTWNCITRRIISILPPLTAYSNEISITDKSMKFNETQLECVATDRIRESTGKPFRKIQLVSYWATCPICKEKLQTNVRIDVSKGGKEFHNRLIGRCSESPTEHVFSFDHITRIGKPLRN